MVPKYRQTLKYIVQYPKIEYLATYSFYQTPRDLQVKLQVL